MKETLASWHERHAGLGRLERDSLIYHHLGLNRAASLTEPNRIIKPEALDRLETDSQRLREGEPLAYILGEWSFWDFDLKITPAVLVPRPETETLVEAALARCRPQDQILDMGTGSGAVAIALARTSQADVTALDVSREALCIARENAERAGAAVRFVHSDWYGGIDRTFNLIVSNPPYVAEQDPHLDELGYEPERALVSGPEGLNDLTRIIQQAPEFLVAGGWLLVEHGYDQAEPVDSLFTAAGFEEITLIRDLGDRPRVTAGRKPERDA